MTLSKMPSTTTLPTTSLKRLTLYKNQLAFTERTAKLTDGLKSANQHSFSLSVPDTTRELTMATLSTVVPGANVAVMVAHDEPALPPNTRPPSHSRTSSCWVLASGWATFSPP